MASYWKFIRPLYIRFAENIHDIESKTKEMLDSPFRTFFFPANIAAVTELIDDSRFEVVSAKVSITYAHLVQHMLRWACYQAAYKDDALVGQSFMYHSTDNKAARLILHNGFQPCFAERALNGVGINLCRNLNYIYDDPAITKGGNGDANTATVLIASVLPGISCKARKDQLRPDVDSTGYESANSFASNDNNIRVVVDSCQALPILSTVISKKL
jgi:hypothetical protein